MNHDGDCSPAERPLLNPNDWYYQNGVRLCPFCLMMSWHMHVCHHENEPSTTSA